MAIAKRDPRVTVASPYATSQRTSRRPQHQFTLRIAPYEIQPFCLAPVLPGETLQSIMLQCQAWSDPLSAKLRNVGWWWQTNFFYVRHRDLPADVRNILAGMMLDDQTDVSSLQAGSASAKLYTYDGAMDWTNLCLQHIVSEYFRDDGEDWNEAVSSDGLPLVRIYGRGTSDPFERLTLDDDYEDRRVDLIDGDGHLYANTISQSMAHWAAMRDAGLTEMDYQDFMKTYGSTVREDEESPNLHRAEDLWSLREFTYPTNTVEPTTGVPAVAAGWRISKSGGKRAFIDEPGFIFGVQYVRPKVYLRPQMGSVAGSMSDVYKWLPAVLNDQADAGHVQFDGTEGPLPSLFEDAPADPGPQTFHPYWIDLRDLLLYGDQFVNYDPTDEPPFLDLPTADGKRRYAATEEIRSFFATAYADTGKFDVDGIASLNILGRQKPSTTGFVLGKA